MGEDPYAKGQQFLTVGGAAKALGLSRMAVRDLVARGRLPARRDNEGRLRVDLVDRPDLTANAAPDGPALVDALFDEVEELQAELTAREARDARLADLLARQDAALSRALTLLDNANPPTRGTATLAARTAQELDATRRENTQLHALLERAFAALEKAAGPEAAALKGEHLKGSVQGVVERDRSQAAASTDERLEALLERALAGAERLERELATRDAELAQQGTALEHALSLTERSLAAAESRADTHAKSGFWRRMFGGTDDNESKP